MSTASLASSFPTFLSAGRSFGSSTPSLALSARDLAARGAGGLWNLANKHKGAIALNAALLAGSLLIPVAGGAIATGIAVRFGVPLLGRAAAALGGRAVTRFALRMVGRSGLRIAGRALRATPRLLGDLVRGAAKGAMALAKGISDAVGAVAGILQNGGGLSTVMAGQDAPGPQAHGQGQGIGNAADRDEPLPGDRARAAMDAAMSGPQQTQQAPRQSAATPSGPGMEI